MERKKRQQVIQSPVLGEQKQGGAGQWKRRGGAQGLRAAGPPGGQAWAPATRAAAAHAAVLGSAPGENTWPRKQVTGDLISLNFTFVCVMWAK